MIQHTSALLLTSVILAYVPAAWGQESARLRESFTVGGRYQVQVRVQLSGTLRVPGEKDKPEPKPLALKGESAINYDERILGVERDGAVNRTIRLFRRVDFERQVGEATQKATLRPTARRIVQVRVENQELAFSPDGPLTWDEIDLLKTDVFTPALAGLLPAREVRVGERWRAEASAVKELTDLEQLEEGGLECRLERIVVVEQRRQARVSFFGTVRGTNEDGPARQQLEGSLVFDLDGQYLASLTLNGKHSPLSAEGKEMGRIEGRFLLSRQPTHGAGERGELGDEALRALVLEPNATNTRLLYENEELGAEFLHPRRWRVSSTQGRQLTLDSSEGHGVLITIDPLAQVPTGAQFVTETRTWLEKQKGVIQKVAPLRTIQGAPQALEQFAVEAELGGQRVVMLYHIARQEKKGATLAARLLPANLDAVQKEVEAIAHSLRLR